MMSRRVWSVVTTAGIVLLSGLELLLRSAAELLPVVGDFVGPILVILLPLVGERPTVTWLLGWLFLGTVAYKTCYLMDSIRVDGEPIRLQGVVSLGAAALAIALGIIVKSQVLGTAFGQGSVPGPVAQNAYKLFLGAVLVYVICASIAALAASAAGEHVTMGTPIGLLVYELPRTLFLGPPLAAAAMLYPLPETAVLSWALVAVGVNTVPFGPQLRAILNDPIERFVVGAAVARTRLTGYITFFYVLAGLLFSVAIIIGSDGTTWSLLTQITGAAATKPAASFFAGVSVFGPPVYGFWYWLRIVERLPYEYEVFASSGASSRRPESVDYHALPPAFGLPIPLLLVPIGVYITVVGNDPFAEGVPAGYVVATGLALLVTVAVVLWTRRIDPASQSLETAVVAPLAVAFHAASLQVMGSTPFTQVVHGLLTSAPIGTVGFGLVGVVGEALLLGVVVLLPAMIPFLLGRESLVLVFAGIYVAGLVVALLLYLLGGMTDGAADIAGFVFLLSPVVWYGWVSVLERFGFW